jgi:hypothetical protein
MIATILKEFCHFKVEDAESGAGFRRMNWAAAEYASRIHSDYLIQAVLHCRRPAAFPGYDTRKIANGQHFAPPSLAMCRPLHSLLPTLQFLSRTS